MSSYPSKHQHNQRQGGNIYNDILHLPNPTLPPLLRALSRRSSSHHLPPYAITLPGRRSQERSGHGRGTLPHHPNQRPHPPLHFIGVLMVLEGSLLALPSTRGSLGALGLNTSLTAAGIYSQRRMGIPYWLPCVNMALGTLVWWTQNRSQL